MNKKYYIYEVASNQVTLWVRTLTLRSSYERLEELKKKFPTKRFYIEVK